MGSNASPSDERDASLILLLSAISVEGNMERKLRYWRKPALTGQLGYSGEKYPPARDKKKGAARFPPHGSIRGSPLAQILMSVLEPVGEKSLILPR